MAKMKRATVLALAFLLVVGTAIGGKKANKKNKNVKDVQVSLRDFGVFNQVEVSDALKMALVEKELMWTGGDCEAIRDNCDQCAKTIGCMWKRVGDQWKCQAHDADSYLSSPLTESFYSETLVDSARHLLLEHAYSNGLSEDELKDKIFEKSAEDIKTELLQLMDDELTEEITKQLMGRSGITHQACLHQGWVAPGMVIPSSDDSGLDAMFRVEKFVAAGSMKLIYFGSILDKDGITLKEIDGTSRCVLKVNQKEPDPTNPVVMGDVRREAIAQRLLNSPKVRDPRRKFVEALYDETKFRGTPIIVSEFVPEGMVAKLIENIARFEDGVDIQSRKVNLNNAPEGWRDIGGLKSILTKWLMGVEYMTDKGFIHHDLHSQNAMFAKENGENTVKIIDFGATAYTRVKSFEDGWQDHGRLRIDIYGQTSNPGAPFGQDSAAYQKSLPTGDDARSSTINKFMCTREQYPLIDPQLYCPDVFDDNLPFEDKIPGRMDSSLRQMHILPYGDKFYQELVTSGKYCSEDPECRAKHLKIRNVYDTVNVVNEYLTLLMCHTDVDCKLALYPKMVPLASDIARVKTRVENPVGDKEENMSPMQRYHNVLQEIDSENYQLKKTLKENPEPNTEEGRENAVHYKKVEEKGKLITPQFPFGYFCPSAEGDRLKEFYTSVGVTAFPDDGKHSKTSIVQAIKLFFFNDANEDLSGQAELSAVLDDDNFLDFILRVMDCDANTRADATELLQHPFLNAKVKHDQHDEITGALQDGTASNTLVPLSAIGSDLRKMTVATMLSNWKWANTATINTNRITEAPYVTPRRRIEIDLKTGKYFIKGFDTSAYKTSQEFIKKMLLPTGGSLPPLDVEEGGRYLWAVSDDWRLIIAPELNIGDDELSSKEDRAGRTWTTPEDSGSFAGEEWTVKPRVVKHGDLTPGYMYVGRRRSKSWYSSDDNPYTPSGHNKALDDPTFDKGSYEKGCIYGQQRYLQRDKDTDYTVPDLLKGIKMSTSNELGQEFWGQCRGPQRLAGELYFIRVDTGFHGVNQGPFALKRLDSIEPTSLCKHTQRPEKITYRWVIDPDSSASFQRNPNLSTGAKSTEDVGVPRIRILIQLLNSIGVEVDHLWTNGATQANKATVPIPGRELEDDDETDVPRNPNPVIIYPRDGDDPAAKRTVCMVKNEGGEKMLFKVKCRNPKRGFRDSKYVEYEDWVGPYGRRHYGADLCLEGHYDACEIVEQWRL